LDENCLASEFASKLTQAASKGIARKDPILDTLGRYSVLDDQTGGEVWSGWRKAFNHSLRCYAALKLIPKAAFPSEESREQFAREVQMAVRIRHRNLAAVFPLETISESHLYAIEFCDGQTLIDRVLENGCLETLEALNVARQIAEGLDAAGSSGLIHRDISADNIVLLQEDDEIAVKVMGLALPSRSALESLSTTARLDFRSPEEIAGKNIDVRSGIFSVGGLLYLMVAGPEKYALFRARLMENEAENPFAHDEELSHRVGMIVRDAVYHDPKKRIATFAELIDVIERARTSPEPSRIEPPVVVPPTVDVAVPQVSPPTEISQPPEESEKPRATEVVTTLTEPREGELMIPPELLKVAQPGTILRLNRVGVELPEQVAVHTGSFFRIGRLGQLELVTRFLPRNKANDTKSKRISKVHTTAKCKGNQILLFDGDGRGTKESASANGSTFQSKALSPTNPLPLVESGELGLAGAYSIKVVPLLGETDEAPEIANLRDWIGTIDENAPSMNGVVVFSPRERSEVNVVLWLFSTATFGISGSSLDFILTPGESAIGTLRYFGGYFWIEQKSTEALLVDDLRLGIGEVAPLTTGQTIEVTGIKYTVDIQELEQVTKRLRK